jgi:hypothetical protein
MALQTDMRTAEFLEVHTDSGVQQTHLKCLCRFDDGAVFAYVERGHDFIRASDRELWAVERDDMLVSARSGVTLAHRRGRVFFADDTDEPLYYERAI